MNTYFSSMAHRNKSNHLWNQCGWGGNRPRTCRSLQPFPPNFWRWLGVSWSQRRTHSRSESFTEREHNRRRGHFSCNHAHSRRIKWIQCSLGFLVVWNIIQHAFINKVIAPLHNCSEGLFLCTRELVALIVLSSLYQSRLQSWRVSKLSTNDVSRICCRYLIH